MWQRNLNSPDTMGHKKSEAFFRPLVVRISLDQERCKASPVISSINESNRGVKAVAGELSSPPANISAGTLHEVVDIDRRRQTGAGAGTQEGRGCEAGVSSGAIIAPQEHKVGDSRQPRQMNRNNLSSNLHSSPLASPQSTQRGAFLSPQ